MHCCQLSNVARALLRADALPQVIVLALMESMRVGERDLTQLSGLFCCQIKLYLLLCVGSPCLKSTPRHA